jgi:hypothetical protein
MRTATRTPLRTCPILSYSLPEGSIGDRRLLEVARCLRQNAAAQGGPSLEQNVGLDQKDDAFRSSSKELAEPVDPPRSSNTELSSYQFRLLNGYGKL